MISRGEHLRWNIVTFCEEPRLAYDRVYLSSFFAGKTAADLSLLPRPTYYDENGDECDEENAVDQSENDISKAEK